MAAQVLRGAVHGVVGAVLERTKVDGRRRGRVDDDAAGVRGGGLEVRHGQERIRGRLEPDEVGAGRRRARLVELDEAQAPALEQVEELAGSVIGALGERDRPPGLELGKDECGDRGRPRGEEQRLAAVELAEDTLGLGPRRVGETLVVEVAGPAVSVRPDR